MKVSLFSYCFLSSDRCCFLFLSFDFFLCHRFAPHVEEFPAWLDTATYFDFCNLIFLILFSLASSLKLSLAMHLLPGLSQGP